MTWAAMGAAAVGVGGSIAGSYLSKDSGDGGGGGGGGMVPSGGSDRSYNYVQLPDYPEAEGARVNWWDTLQDWQGQPGYGAIAPDWDEIWKNAASKVQRFYGGGPEGQGEFGRAKAGLARRGVSEQGAADTVLSRLGMQQGNTLSDMAVKQAIEKANLSESGRKTWLNSLQRLAGLKPQYQTGNQTTTDFDYMEPYAGGAGGGVMGQLLEGGLGMGGIDDLLGQFGFGGAGSGDTGIGDITDLLGGGGGGDSGGGLMEMITGLLSGEGGGGDVIMNMISGSDGGGMGGDGLDVESLMQLLAMSQIKTS